MNVSIVVVGLENLSIAYGFSEYRIGGVVIVSQGKPTPHIVRESVKRMVRKIDEPELRKLLGQVLLEALSERSEADRGIICSSISEVRIVDEYDIPGGGAMVERLKNGRWILLLSSDELMPLLEGDDFVEEIMGEAASNKPEIESILRALPKESLKQLIHHEFDEIIQEVSRGEDIHMLVFISDVDVRRMEVECSICHKVTSKYFIPHPEVLEENPYLEELSKIEEELGLGEEGLILCDRCFYKCCRGCRHISYCDWHCRVPEEWLGRLRQLISES